MKKLLLALTLLASTSVFAYDSTQRCSGFYPNGDYSKKLTFTTDGPSIDEKSISFKYSKNILGEEEIVFEVDDLKMNYTGLEGNFNSYVTKWAYITRTKIDTASNIVISEKEIIAKIHLKNNGGSYSFSLEPAVQRNGKIQSLGFDRALHLSCNKR